jgi:hypothetical protein
LGGFFIAALLKKKILEKLKSGDFGQRAVCLVQLSIFSANAFVYFYKSCVLSYPRGQAFIFTLKINRLRSDWAPAVKGKTNESH